MAPPRKGIGVAGALSIGIGGIVGGGFFATFGLAVLGARGATPLAFALGGILALLTAHSYVQLTLRYPGTGGTVSFIRAAFGDGWLPAAVNVLLILSYVAVMAIYARALAGYSVSSLPEADREPLARLVASGALVALGLVNLAGAALMSRFETVFNVGKLGALSVFIVGGLFLGAPSWARLGPANWVPWSAIVSSGMVVFLSYEGFELISNASDRIVDPRRTLPIAFYGSILAAGVIYLLAVVVAVGHMPFEAMQDARDFALSATAATFLGRFGFGLLTFGAVFASASAINADYFGAGQLPVMLGSEGELPRVFSRELRGRAVPSLAVIAILALLAVNLLDLQALSAATSGGFLVVYAVVNLSNARLSQQPGSRWISLLAALLCLAALAIMVGQFASDPGSRGSAWAVGAVLAIAMVVEGTFRAFRFRTRS